MKIDPVAYPQAVEPPYVFTKNNAYDRDAAIELVVPQKMGSQQYMQTIRDYRVPPDAIAIWYLGQNGFLLKDATGPLIGIDLYLTNSCADKFAQLPYRLDRQLPIFIEPEDLDIDVFITTHSHDDHADPETIRRLTKTRTSSFLGPFDSMRVYQECGIPLSSCRLIHPGEMVSIGSSVTVQATFALPTDATDLNHTGMLFQFSNGISFYNSGDTAYSEGLTSLLPTDVEICAICINGGFHNLSPMQAATIAKAIRPRVVLPCHYDMMVNNVGSPEMLRVALDLLGSNADFFIMKYYEPWLYKLRQDQQL
ncbi:MULTISPECIES: MBL fold metallo-hydrolase [Acidobacteriaceae]|uniref:MBL fold metallo-hydrolase n=1 Tax=Acidobacteriaceae TaxID=204434 RepID=UPI001C20AF80|nr:MULTISPECIES: MBL fold metallo-hydrolase [Acidobacteriaceae]MDW5265988.1 MBL fold metallo-hydrolase [Edaphobacter sp.]